MSSKVLPQIYFANIHAYLNYTNMIWVSTHKTKLKNAQSKQNDALRIIFSQSKPLSSEPPFLRLNVLNVYQIDIFKSVQYKTKILRISS